MNPDPSLREKYSLARCCRPEPDQEIMGYFSFDDHVKVHRASCANLSKAESSRLVSLAWDEILESPSSPPPPELAGLDEIDLAVLRHHRDYDIDYSHKVARMLGLEKEIVFERHQKLRNLGLLDRVEAVMVQYRKKITKNKWIKHRNHTYYRLTPRGAACLELAGQTRSEKD